MSKDGEKEPKQERKGDDPKGGTEDDEECGFCRYMKAGGCKQEFTAWSKCVDENREEGKDFAEECRDTTISLQECMLEHKDYYKDFLGDDTADSGKGKGEESKDGGSKEDRKGEGEKQEQGKKGSSNEGEKPDGKKDGEQEAQGKKGSSNEGEKPDGKKDGEQEAKGKKGEGKKSEGGQPEASSAAEAASKPSKDQGEEGGKSSGSSKGQTEALKSSQQDSLAKQARTIEQETHPVKAKPSESKMSEAQAEPPKPERKAPKEESEEDDGGEEAEEEEEEKPEIKVETVPADRRFVTTNQARHCYTRYQEYHRCAAEKGEDSEECSFFQRAYRSICPSEWVEKWNEQREEGTFAGRY